MVNSNAHNPSTELKRILLLDSLALEVFKKNVNKKNKSVRGYAKEKMQTRGFSLDELCSIHPFYRSNKPLNK